MIAWTRNEIEGHIALAHDWFTAKARGDKVATSAIGAHLAAAGCDVERLEFTQGGIVLGAIGFGEGETRQHAEWREKQRALAPNQCSCGFEVRP